jgi:hypothetical protein
VAVARVKARLPVRSALFKQDTGGLVVRWVTTSEAPLLYVFVNLLFLLVEWSGAGRYGSVCGFGPTLTDLATSFYLPLCWL